MVAATRRVRNPAIRQPASPPQLRDPVLNVPIAGIGLFDRFGHSRIGHAVEHMAHRLRMILRQHVEDLRVKLIDSGAGAPAPFIVRVR